jgi:3-methyladenine DNA glycosylase/8-oxoguanine DNA glycosylase
VRERITNSSPDSAARSRLMILKHKASLEFAMPGPFSFELTVNKPAGWHWATPAETFRNGKFWTGIYLDSRPVGLKMHAAGLNVRTDIYQEATARVVDLQALELELRRALGEEEDIKGFYKFARSEPLLDEVVSHLQGMRLGTDRDLFGRVILAICLQMAPLKRSRQMMDLLLAEFGTPLDFDRHKVTLWPRPEVIAVLEPSILRARAKLGYRAERLISAARYLADNSISAEKLDTLPDKEARGMVMTIPGIGEYSAGIILGRRDVPVDSWSVVILSELILGSSPKNGRGDIPALNELIKKRWGRWGWLAFAYIVNDLPYLASKYRLSRIY